MTLSILLIFPLSLMGFKLMYITAKDELRLLSTVLYPEIAVMLATSSLSFITVSASFNVFNVLLWDAPGCNAIETVIKLSSSVGINSPGVFLINRTPKTIFPISMRRSEEHTSELQSCLHFVCHLMLEKK